MYALAVFLVAPLGLVAVALAAAAVHTGFLLVAYLLMLRGASERPLRSLWKDIAPATVSCMGLAAAAVPTSIALSAGRVAAVPYLIAVSAVAGLAYVSTLRVGFPAELTGLRNRIAQVLPQRPGHALSRRRSPVGTEASW
jgi:hypothetical protein